MRIQILLAMPTFADWVPDVTSLLSASLSHRDCYFSWYFSWQRNFPFSVLCSIDGFSKINRADSSYPRLTVVQALNRNYECPLVESKCQVAAGLD